jgi:hypothetical protein
MVAVAYGRPKWVVGRFGQFLTFVSVMALEACWNARDQSLVWGDGNVISVLALACLSPHQSTFLAASIAVVGLFAIFRASARRGNA